MTDEATKLPLESANIVNENITKLGQLFPEIMADGKSTSTSFARSSATV